MTNTSYGNVTISDRKNIDITGVKSVDSFDEFTITLSIGGGDLTVEGENLTITILDLDKGRVAASGFISAVYYGDVIKEKPKKTFSRIFGKN